jgi:hypothetical protein
VLVDVSISRHDKLIILTAIMGDPLQTPPPTLEYFATPPPPFRPPALAVIAWVFVAFGVWAAVDMATSLFQGRIKIDLNILMIFVGRGLLRNSRGWRTIGLIFLWIALISLPVAMALSLFYPSAGSIQFNGQPIPISLGIEAREVILLIAIGSFWAASFWAYRVLTRPDVRRLFRA